MDTKIYPVEIDILLKSVGEPFCKITLGDQVVDVKVRQQERVKLITQGNGPIRLSIEHHSKLRADPSTALIVDEIKFDGLSNFKFVCEGVYRPIYPKYIDGAAELPNNNYLAWNGVWTLDFTLPIYTWIHNIDGLGWIYD